METKHKNEVLARMDALLAERAAELLEANRLDAADCDPEDRALYDRLLLSPDKVEDMRRSLQEVRAKPDPVGVLRYSFRHPNGLKVENRSAPFGTILIIYESRPDVTIEAAALAFKAGNRILLKGGKEARLSNLLLVECWQEALRRTGLPIDWITYLDYTRQQTQTFLQNPDPAPDLIVPRGGERLIAFVRQHARCPVLVSGRGNNFLYVHSAADWNMAPKVILNAKTNKISACNALDKVLLDRSLPHLKPRALELLALLEGEGVEVLLDPPLAEMLGRKDLAFQDEGIWEEEFLAMKIVLGLAEGLEDAIEKINRWSGKHSAAILSEEETAARRFMQEVDAAAVYHNTSTRFTDGGQFGLGAELAISTDKLHHRGPLGLEHLVTNKWYVYGTGQTRS